jgi:hypothetical protein
MTEFIEFRVDLPKLIEFGLLHDGVTYQRVLDANSRPHLFIVPRGI